MPMRPRCRSKLYYSNRQASVLGSLVFLAGCESSLQDGVSIVKIVHPQPLRAMQVRVSPRILFLVILVAEFLGPSGFCAHALPQGEAQATSQNSSAFDNALRQFQESWQRGTSAERKKMAETLIGEADKLPDSNPQKARGLLLASSV